MANLREGELVYTQSTPYYKAVTCSQHDCNRLYEMLAERNDTINISHDKMPEFKDHVSYIGSRPYQIWYLIYDAEICVGQVYLSKNNELGVQIFKEFQNRGYGQMALNFMIETYKSINLLANINPKNEKSIKLFEKLGFKHIQNTYKRDATARPSSLSPT